MLDLNPQQSTQADTNPNQTEDIDCQQSLPILGAGLCKTDLQAVIDLSFSSLKQEQDMLLQQAGHASKKPSNTPQ